MLARRVFVLLFVLLQCIGPLLHAHAGAAGSPGARTAVQAHSGIHLPGLVLETAPRCPEAHAQAATDTLAVTVAASLEARDEFLPADTPAPVRQPAGPGQADDPPRLSVESPRIPAPSPHHLLPPACAPPRV